MRWAVKPRFYQVEIKLSDQYAHARATGCNTNGAFTSVLEHGLGRQAYPCGMLHIEYFPQPSRAHARLTTLCALYQPEPRLALAGFDAPPTNGIG